MEATANAGGDHGGLEGPQGKQGRWSSEFEVHFEAGGVLDLVQLSPLY